MFLLPMLSATILLCMHHWLTERLASYCRRNELWRYRFCGCTKYLCWEASSKWLYCLDGKVIDMNNVCWNNSESHNFSPQHKVCFLSSNPFLIPFTLHHWHRVYYSIFWQIKSFLAYILFFIVILFHLNFRYDKEISNTFYENRWIIEV